MELHTFTTEPDLLPRRRFLAGLVGILAAPAVVRAASLMPVRVIEPILTPLRGPVDWGDVVTTTLKYRSKLLAENISNNNALLLYLRNDPILGGSIDHPHLPISCHLA